MIGYGLVTIHTKSLKQSAMIKRVPGNVFLCYSVVGDCHLHLILIPGTLESNEGAHGAERQAIHWQAGAFWPNPIGLWRAVEMAMRPVLVECGAVPNQ